MVVDRRRRCSRRGSRRPPRSPTGRPRRRACGRPSTSATTSGACTACSPNAALIALRLGHVVERRGGAVGDDVVDLVGRDAGRDAAPSSSPSRRRGRSVPGREMWYASAVSAAPAISARIVAPRSSACSADSTTRMPAPSPKTKPSRVRSNGRDAPWRIVVALRQRGHVRRAPRRPSPAAAPRSRRRARCRTRPRR